MNKYFYLYPIVFLCFHLFGALSAILDLSINFTRETDRNFNIGNIFHSYAALEISQYLILAIILSFLFLYTHYQIANSIIKRLTKNPSPLLIHLLWSITISLSLLTTNANFFIQSAFYMPEYLILRKTNPALLIMFAIIILPILLAPLYLYSRHRKTFYGFTITLILITLLLIPNHSQHITKTDKPNIIFIGIDSLRPELISQHMPFLNEQLKSSTIFENAYTPFARTYPSWMSIVTGRHPVNHKARFNLQPESMLASDNQYLPMKLKALGYQSIYASDERRFSNLGETQGFDQTIGPRTGAADFILGNYADFPLLNLLTITPLSMWLLPELYANRAAAHLYHPNQFNDLLSYELSTISDKPLFLSTHFCLAHWPYTFVGHTNLSSYKEKPAYPANLKAVDHQIKSLHAFLSDKGILNNSRIVYLSDHGESWGNVPTGLYNSDKEELNILDHGHGMSILSPTSHKVLLAIKGFKTPSGKSNRLTSLIDISPTILDELGLPHKIPLYDGNSLLQSTPSNIEISFESGVVIAAANKADPDPQAVAKAGMNRFNVLKNGMLRLKESSIEEMTNQKQLGLRLNEIGLARGKFTGVDTEFLLLNYQLNSYTRHTSLAGAFEIQPILVKRFCELFASSDSHLNEKCVQL